MQPVAKSDVLLPLAAWRDLLSARMALPTHQQRS
jgi:hypothetical protein